MKPEPGLGKRIEHAARRISSQHRQLDEFYGLVATAIEEARPDEAAAAFRCFADALEAHFAMEENVHFPALHSLRPELAERLSSVESEHADLRERIAAVSDRLAGGDLSGAEGAFDLLVTRLAAHEGKEEGIVEEIGAAGRAP